MEPGPNDPTRAKPSNSYLKYANLTLQLCGAIALAAWAGHKLDQYLGIRFPAFLLSFVLMAFAGMMVMVYKGINKE